MSRIRVLARSGFGKNSLFPAWLHRVGHGEEKQMERHRDKTENSGVSPHKDTNPTGLLFHPMSSFNLN